MTQETKTFGRSSLLSLSGRLEIKITKLLGKRKTKLFCKQHEKLITSRFNNEHHCLKPKRIYTNKEGKEVVIFCPHLMTLGGKQFYKENEAIIYQSLEEAYLVEPEFKHRPIPPPTLKKLEKERNLDVITKTARNIQSIKKAYYDLTGSV